MFVKRCDLDWQRNIWNEENVSKVLSSVHYLSRQGLTLRGDGDESDSTFMQLINLRSEDDERILDWIKKSQINIPHQKCGQYRTSTSLSHCLKWVNEMFEIQE